MIIDGKQTPVPDNAPKRDWFLRFLVNLANKNRFELEITLNVGGLLISGTLAGVKKYFAGFGENFAASIGASKESEEIMTTFKKIGDECACVSHPEQTDAPSYIHLKNARFFATDGKMIEGDSGIWWRGRISEVQGFVLGSLVKPSVASQAGKEKIAQGVNS